MAHNAKRINAARNFARRVVKIDWAELSLVKMVMDGHKQLALKFPAMKPRIRINPLPKLVALAEMEKEAEAADLYVSAYRFLFRVGNEAIPLQKGDAMELTALPPGRHSAVFIDRHHNLVVKLKSRKNRPQGSILHRKCTCMDEAGPRCCAPCRFSRRLNPASMQGRGDRLFSIRPQQLLLKLRRHLTLLGVPDANSYGLHAFRRGCAMDMAAAGAPLWQILAAGEWKSAAFRKYLDEHEIESMAFAAFAADFSDDE